MSHHSLEIVKEIVRSFEDKYLKIRVTEEEKL